MTNRLGIPNNENEKTRPISGRVRQFVRYLYKIRSLHAVQIVRRAVFAALLLLATATVVSNLRSSHLATVQAQIKSLQQKAIADGKSTPIITAKIENLERQADEDSHFVQVTYAAQGILIVLVLALCYLNFIGDRILRERQGRKLRNANRRLSRLVEVDGLTELKNRRAFEEKLLEEWERANRYDSALSLLLIDVDHFKQYNDSFGHLAGDLALKMVAEILKQHGRRNDFSARYGGEEFAVLLPHTGAGAALVAAERIRAAFLATRWPERPVTVSIGVATLTPDIESPEQFVNHADQALYFAKNRGRNRVIHARDTVKPL